MEIHEERVYMFRFKTDDGDIQFPIRAMTKEDAAVRMQNLLGRMQTEVAMDFPRIGTTGNPPGADQIPIEPGIPSAIAADGLAELAGERLDALLGELGAGELTPKAKAKTVENWSGLKYLPENYAKIVHELELIKSGRKEIPPGK